MDRAVLVAGGNLFQMPPALQNDFIIAVDSGLDHCRRFSLRPRLLIGDLDSVSPAALQWAEQIGAPHLPTKLGQELTDTELAVEYALAQGTKNILILGGLGSRIDHSLANLQLLPKIAKEGAKGEITDGRQRVLLLEQELTLPPAPGLNFSLLPLTPFLEGLSIRGAMYPLEEATIQLGKTRTLSNQFQDRTVELTLKKGLAFVFLYPQSF